MKKIIMLVIIAMFVGCDSTPRKPGISTTTCYIILPDNEEIRLFVTRRAPVAVYTYDNVTYTLKLGDCKYTAVTNDFNL